MFTKKLALFVVVLIALVACQPAGPSAKDLAATTVADAAKTQAALPPTVTSTTAPTETPAATSTVTPTAAPTFTATPSGPLMIKDDFESKTDIWGKCEKCEWKDGKLYFGPFPPRGQGIDQVFSIPCLACGEHTYFRIAADLTFSSGVAGDRAYGVGLADPGKFYAGTSIAPSLFGNIEAYDFDAGNWTGGKFKRYSAIKAGTLTNRVEFTAKPNAAGGTDFYAAVNGKNILVLTNIIKRSTTGLKPSIYLAWHSVGITVDNFEYEEIVP